MTAPVQREMTRKCLPAFTTYGFVRMLKAVNMAKRFKMTHKCRLLAGLTVFCSATMFAVVAAADRITDYVSPSLLQEPSDNPANSNCSFRVSAVQPETAETLLARPRRNNTTAERLQAFDAEFGIQQKYPGWLQSSTQSAKHTLDKASFQLQEFVYNVEEALTFDYELRSLAGGPAASKDESNQSSRQFYGPRQAIENARFKSDVDIKPGGRSFFGVRLELPFGD
jgi:hypothetical protein